MAIDSLIKILQGSISPAVLISGFGLLLLTKTNRLGRTIDRVRQLKTQLDTVVPDKRDNIIRQTAILFKRSRILQVCITFNIGGIFAVSLTMLLLFLTFILALPLEGLIEASFFIGVSCLIISLVFFLADISLALQSLKVEMEQN